MFASFLNTIEKYKMLEENDHVILGLSGGADSVCLLHCLLAFDRFPIWVSAVHINHGLRGEESKRDEEFVRALCMKKALSLHVAAFDVAKEAAERRLSLEETGRILRAQEFERVRQEVGATKIALAHNKNDNAETLLMRLFRGTGLEGLSGIPAVRGFYIRPLLETEREEIEAYLSAVHGSFVQDSTNFQLLYSRNKIRNFYLPQIQKDFNASIIKTLAKSAELFKEENAFLEAMAKEGLFRCTEHSQQKGLCIQTLSTYAPVLQKRIVRLFLKNYNPSLKDYSYQHVEAVLGLLKKQSGKKIELPGGLSVYREFERLCILEAKAKAKVEAEHKSEHESEHESEQESKPKHFAYSLELGELTFIPECGFYASLSNTEIPVHQISKIKLGKDKSKQINLITIYTKRYSYDKINVEYPLSEVGCKLSLRTRQNGDRVLTGKKLKEIFQEKKIPLSERDSITLLAYESLVIFILDERFAGWNQAVENRSGEGENFYLQIWEEVNNEGKSFGSH